jgi:hypothetical protein
VRLQPATGSVGLSSCSVLPMPAALPTSPLPPTPTCKLAQWDSLSSALRDGSARQPQTRLRRSRQQSWALYSPAPPRVTAAATAMGSGGMGIGGVTGCAAAVPRPKGCIQEHREMKAARHHHAAARHQPAGPANLPPEAGPALGGCQGTGHCAHLRYRYVWVVGCQLLPCSLHAGGKLYRASQNQLAACRKVQPARGGPREGRCGRCGLGLQEMG